MRYQAMEKTNQHEPSRADNYGEVSSNDEHYITAKVVAILSYLTLIGWLVAIVLHGTHKSNFASFHLRQSLGLIITGALLALIPLIGWLLNVTVFIAWLYVFYHVIQGHEKKVPLLGNFYQEHLDFIK